MNEHNGIEYSDFGLLALLRAATDIAGRLPTREDSWVSAAIKLLSVVDVLERKFVGTSTSTRFGCGALEEEVLPAFTEFFFASGLDRVYQAQRMNQNGRNVVVLKYKIGDHKLFLLENQNSHFGTSIERVVGFTKGLDLAEVLSRGWGLLGNRVVMHQERSDHYIFKPVFTHLPERPAPTDSKTRQSIATWSARIAKNPAMVFLLHGPPGTGKSLFAETIAASKRLLKVDASVLNSDWHNLFDELKILKPEVLLFDDFDTVSNTKRFRGLLEQLHGLGATTFLTVNDTSALDSALLRSERIDWAIEFSLPDLDQRVEVLTGLGLTDCQWLAENTDGYNLADLSAIAHRLQYQTAEEAVREMSGLRALAAANSSDKTDEIPLGHGLKAMRPWST